MSQLLTTLLYIPKINWPPTPTSDFGELLFVSLTIALSFSILVAFGLWWQR